MTEPDIVEIQDNIQNGGAIFLWLLGGVVCVCVLLFFVFGLLARPPQTFPAPSSYTVEFGTNVADIADDLHEAGYVRSPNVLLAFLVLVFDAKDIKAGTYQFDQALGARELAKHIIEVGPKDPLLQVTFPEGMSVKEIARIAAAALPEFNEASFISSANDFEGRLFPETYFVPENFTDAELFDLLRETYEERVALVADQIAEHTLTEAEVVILASILEREANTEDSMRLVSSVLQNRLAIDMPLQADATMEYVLEKPLSELTPEDLKIPSPYNTYLNRGLTPTPIGNPGLTAIRAVLEPTPSDYFYYITDPDGVFHYAETFDEHKANIARYLR